MRGAKSRRLKRPDSNGGDAAAGRCPGQGRSEFQHGVMKRPGEKVSKSFEIHGGFLITISSFLIDSRNNCCLMPFLTCESKLGHGILSPRFFGRPGYPRLTPASYNELGQFWRRPSLSTKLRYHQPYIQGNQICIP